MARSTPAPPTSEKAPARRARSASAPGGGGNGAAKGPDLRSEMRDFVTARPGGWDHDDWSSFLEHLRGRGHPVEDQAAVGSALERERLCMAVEKIPGMGPARVRKVVETFGRIWEVRTVSVDEVAERTGLPRNLADKSHAYLPWAAELSLLRGDLTQRKPK